jgi:hypothetical protein
MSAGAELPEQEHHIEATEPGQKVQLDCVYVSRLSGTKGTVWQHTAIDVASAYAWAELKTSKRNPRTRHTRELIHRIARELRAAGWKLGEVTTDNGSEFRGREFGDQVAQLGARQRFIKAGRPNSNGCVERLQLTILEECWRPAFARSLGPRSRPHSATRPVPPPLQLRSRPHRAPHQRPGPRRYRLRRPQNQAPEMTPTCRYISGLGRSGRDVGSTFERRRSSPEVSRAAGGRDRLAQHVFVSRELDAPFWPRALRAPG